MPTHWEMTKFVITDDWGIFMRTLHLNKLIQICLIFMCFLIIPLTVEMVYAKKKGL